MAELRSAWGKGRTGLRPKSSKRKRAIVIGITGGLGTGKTTAAKAFEALGAKVLDADKIAHETLKKGAPSYRKVVKGFGGEILDDGGEIRRAGLAGLAFRNKRALKRLCDIVHPVVIKKIKTSISLLSKRKNVPAIVIDAPLLIEAGLHTAADYIVVVKTSRATQVKRAMKKTRLSYAEVMKRIRNQMPLSKKIRMADYIVNNEGSMKNVKKATKKIWEDIKSGRE